MPETLPKRVDDESDLEQVIKVTSNRLVTRIKEVEKQKKSSEERLNRINIVRNTLFGLSIAVLGIVIPYVYSQEQECQIGQHNLEYAQQLIDNSYRECHNENLLLIQVKGCIDYNYFSQEFHYLKPR